MRLKAHCSHSARRSGSASSHLLYDRDVCDVAVFALAPGAAGLS
jgi:hypothetical protein